MTGTDLIARRYGRKMSVAARREAWTGWLLATPAIAGFIIWTAGPMLVSLYMSFTNWDLLTQATWVGLNNFRDIFASGSLALHSLKVTSIYAFVSVPLRLIIAMAIAILMNQKLKGMNIFRTIYYLPSVIAGVAVALLWRWIFNPNFGIMNSILWRLFNIDGPDWLMDENWALPAFIIMSLWGVGGDMLIYLAGLQGIPTELYEAAEIDGANTWRRFLSITLPMMTPVLFFNLVRGIIASLQVFSNAYVMTDGGPNNATLFFVLLLYRNAFQYFKMGYASALAWVLFVYILLLTLLVFRSSSYWVYYESQLRNER